MGGTATQKNSKKKLLSIMYSMHVPAILLMAVIRAVS